MNSHTRQRQESLEKLLRYVLGVAPDEFGLHPEGDGFIPLRALLAALRDEEGWRGLKEGDVLRLANQPGGHSPFELAEAGIRLKPALVSPPPEAPTVSALPKQLYVSLKPAAWAVISRRGLHPKTGEEAVRLWSEADLALKVGRRISALAVLVTVQAMKAHKAGAVFRPYSQRLWLTAEVPAAFLSGPPIPLQEEAPAPRRSLENTADQPGASAGADLTPLIHRGKKKGRHGDAPDWKNQRRRERRRDRED